MSFKPNWIERAHPDPSTGFGAAWSGGRQPHPKPPPNPAEGSFRAAPAGPNGLVNAGWLKTLKNSARNWAVSCSLNFQFFDTETSQLRRPESRKRLRVELPTVPSAGGVRTELPLK